MGIYNVFLSLFNYVLKIINNLSQLGYQKIENKNLAFNILITNYIVLALLPICIFSFWNARAIGFTFQLRYILASITLFFVLWANKEGKIKISRHLFLAGVILSVFIYPILIQSIHLTHFLWFPYGLILVSLVPIVIFDWQSEKIDLLVWVGIFFVLIAFIDTWMVYNMNPTTKYDLTYVLKPANKITHLMIWLCTNLLVFFLKRVSASKEQQLKNLNDKLQHQMILMLSQNEEIATQNEELIRSQEQISLQRDTIVTQKKQIEFKSYQLSKFNQALLKFNKDQIIQLGDWQQALNYITENAAKLGNISRVSIWRFKDNQQSLECLKMYHSDTNTFTGGQIIFEEKAPRYFREVRNGNTIIASDTFNHPTLQDFKEGYLEPFEICSMLDAPFFLEGELAGVVCLEQQYKFTDWPPEMISFAQSISDIITIAYKAYLLRQERETIEEQSIAIERQNEELKDKQTEIEKINAELEQRVLSRTKDLELQNEKLAEYAFINAHLLRGPLCRVKGLANLLEMDEMKNDFEILLQRMQLSVKELDDVVLRINQTLEEENQSNDTDLRVFRDKIREKVI